VPLGPGMSVALQHSMDDLATVDPTSPPKTTRTAWTTTWRLGGRTELSTTATLARTGAGARRLEVFSTATVLLGRRTAASVTDERARGSERTDMEIQRSLPVGPGLGYRLRGERAHVTQAHGEVVYQSAFGRYEAVRDVGPGSPGSSYSAAGGLVAIGRSLHLTRAVTNSYALVRVPDGPGVRVYANNQEVGRTDGRGRLLVPNLLAYQANRLAIDAGDLPVDRSIERTAANIAPPMLGGAVVTFSTRRIQAVTGTMALERQGVHVVPSFGEITIVVGDETYVSPVGSEGEFYFENLPPGAYPARLRFADTSCAFTLEMPVSSAPLVDLGAVVCHAASGS